MESHGKVMEFHFQISVGTLIDCQFIFQEYWEGLTLSVRGPTLYVRI